MRIVYLKHLGLRRKGSTRFACTHQRRRAIHMVCHASLSEAGAYKRHIAKQPPRVQLVLYNVAPSECKLIDVHA